MNAWLSELETSKAAALEGQSGFAIQFAHWRASVAQVLTYRGDQTLHWNELDVALSDESLRLIEELAPPEFDAWDKLHQAVREFRTTQVAMARRDAVQAKWRQIVDEIDARLQSASQGNEQAAFFWEEFHKEKGPLSEALDATEPAILEHEWALTRSILEWNVALAESFNGDNEVFLRIRQLLLNFEESGLVAHRTRHVPPLPATESTADSGAEVIRVLCNELRAELGDVLIADSDDGRITFHIGKVHEYAKRIHGLATWFMNSPTELQQKYSLIVFHLARAGEEAVSRQQICLDKYAKLADLSEPLMIAQLDAVAQAHYAFRQAFLADPMLAVINKWLSNGRLPKPETAPKLTSLLPECRQAQMNARDVYEEMHSAIKAVATTIWDELRVIIDQTLAVEPPGSLSTEAQSALDALTKMLPKHEIQRHRIQTTVRVVRRAVLLSSRLANCQFRLTAAQERWAREQLFDLQNDPPTPKQKRLASDAEQQLAVQAHRYEVRFEIIARINVVLDRARRAGWTDLSDITPPARKTYLSVCDELRTRAKAVLAADVGADSASGGRPTRTK